MVIITAITPREPLNFYRILSRRLTIPGADYRHVFPARGIPLTPLLRSYPAERMRAWPVGPAVNHPRNEGAALMAAVPVQVSG
ncbi:MAG: hypothetical protein HC889_20590 [Synechococcaceae cyanobacterium SM1_2_3]|nr:hypothetical protein [Synechococcaceae cyanobacterium SM1_2_3]